MLEIGATCYGLLCETRRETCPRLSLWNVISTVSTVHCCQSVRFVFVHAPHLVAHTRDDLQLVALQHSQRMLRERSLSKIMMNGSKIATTALNCFFAIGMLAIGMARIKRGKEELFTFVFSWSPIWKVTWSYRVWLLCIFHPRTLSLRVSFARVMPSRPT